MNKFVALALAACLFAAVSAQNNTGNGTALSWCRANTDCNQTQGLCCSANGGGLLSYTQFNCNKHTNGTTTAGKCVANGTDFNSLCVGQAKICTSTATKAAYCGGSVGMAAIDVLPNIECTSSAYSLMMSVALLAIVALSYAF